MASLPKEMKALRYVLYTRCWGWPRNPVGPSRSAIVAPSANALESRRAPGFLRHGDCSAFLAHTFCRYEKPEDFSIVTVPLPKLRDNDVLVQVKACGVCGTGELAPY